MRRASAKPYSTLAVAAALGSFLVLVVGAALAGPAGRATAVLLLSLHCAFLVWGVSRFPMASRLRGVSRGRRGEATVGPFAPVPTGRPSVILAGCLIACGAVWWTMHASLHLGASDSAALAMLLAITWALVAWLVLARSQAVWSWRLAPLWREQRRSFTEALSRRRAKVFGQVRILEPCTAPGDFGACAAWCAILEIDGKVSAVSEVGAFELRNDQGAAVIEPTEYALAITVDKVTEPSTREAVQLALKPRLGSAVTSAQATIFVGRIREGAQIEVTGTFGAARRATKSYRASELVTRLSDSDNDPVLICHLPEFGGDSSDKHPPRTNDSSEDRPTRA